MDLIVMQVRTYFCLTKSISLYYQFESERNHLVYFSPDTMRSCAHGSGISWPNRQLNPREYGNRYPLPHETRYCLRRARTISQCVGRKFAVGRACPVAGARSGFHNGGSKMAGHCACDDE